jgi:hypothetical protein
LVHTNILCYLLRYSFFIGTFKLFSLRPSFQIFRNSSLLHFADIDLYLQESSFVTWAEGLKI